ncbi:MAG: hypothetical protein NTV63_03590 [Candidatus Woesearchaeota archaeon]|nr:hypothetical protein [Candidatus Woesearchaeota archaeon]
MAYEKLIDKLKDKGWSDNDIVHALKILNDAPSHKDKSQIAMDSAVYWIGLILMIVGNIVLSVIMIPTLIVLSKTALYFILIVISLAFGTMFSLLLNQIEAIQGKKIIAPLFIPALALINIYYITSVSNTFSSRLNIQKVNSPVAMGIVYAFFFILPYIIFWLTKKVKIEF